MAPYWMKYLADALAEAQSEFPSSVLLRAVLDKVRYGPLLVHHCHLRLPETSVNADTAVFINSPVLYELYPQ